MIAYDMLGSWGELGNQLFEIAATSVHAKRNNTNAVFSPWYCVKSKRKFSNILQSPVDETLNAQDISTVWQEPGHDHHDIPYNENMCLRGYFQSEKYWDGYYDYVRDSLIKPADYITEYLNTRYKDIINCNDTVAVHIRSQTRTQHDDQVNHMPPRLDYLKRAFDVFGKNNNFVIFSDNIPLMKEWFKNYDFIFVENGRPYDNDNGESPLPESTEDLPVYDNVIEMFLMSKLNNAITTSSSFGWWGAWLMDNPDKHIVAMDESMWFGGDLQKSLNLSDLIPESWEKIKC